MLKQETDLFGPWQSFQWDGDAEAVLRLWSPYKVSLWEMTCALKADWYIVPQKLETDYIKKSRKWFSNVTEVLRNHTKGVVSPEDIPWEKYDVVITLDPILDKEYSPLLAYYMCEHTDHLYGESLKQPLMNYDLFLAHAENLNSSDCLTALPKTIVFPYLRDYSLVRQIFKREKAERLWIDYNMMRIANASPWKLGHKNVLRDASNRFKMSRFLTKLRHMIPYDWMVDTKKPVGIDPAKMDDGRIYLDSLSKCNYYLGFELGRNKVGQTLADAASLGCICFGEKNVTYHEAICHPFCLLNNIDSFLDKFHKVRKSTILQEEVKNWQDKALDEFFLKRPLDMLKKACEIKKGE
jgi:hypothetical protein